MTATQIRLNQIFKSAATDGQMLAWDDAAVSWVVVDAPTSGALVLDDLTDVDTASTPPTDGQALLYDDGASLWKPGDLPSGGSLALDDLTDVDATSPADGDVLAFDSGSGDWVPAAPSGGNAIDAVPASPDAWDYEFTANTATLPSGYAWLNQGSATYVEAAGAGALACPGQTYQLHDILKNVPAGTAWQVTAKIELIDGMSDVTQGGVTLQNSAGTKRTTIAKRGRQALVTVADHNNVSSFVGNKAGLATAYAGPVVYIRVTKNSATSYDAHISDTGVSWTALVTAQNFTTHLGTIDKIGFGIDPEVAASPGRMLIHWARKTA